MAVGHHMLVVESEVAVREALLRARSGEGIRVTHAVSLDAALRLAGEDAGVVVVVVGQHEAEPVVDPGTVKLARGVLRFGDLELDPGMRQVRRGRRLLELTFTEFRLLELLMRNPRQVLTRHLIFERVWGFDFASTSNTHGRRAAGLHRLHALGRRHAEHGVRHRGLPRAQPDPRRVRDRGRGRRLPGRQAQEADQDGRGDPGRRGRSRGASTA